MNNIWETTYSIPHTQYPDIKFVRPGTPYPKSNDSSVSIHPNSCIDDFIDRLVEGRETGLPERDPVILAPMLLQWEYESKYLPVMELFRFHVNGQILHKTLRIKYMINVVLLEIFEWKDF